MKRISVVKILSTLCVALIGLLGLTGCGPVKVPPVATYTISCPLISFPAKHTRTRAILLVNTPVADPGYETANMIYVSTPFELSSFATHRWIDTPGDLLLPIIADRIRNKNYFKAVVTPPYLGLTNYRLDLRLQMLQQEFLQPQSHVRLKINAMLMDSNNRIIVNRVFQTCISATGNDPYSGVRATNQAAAQLSEQIACWVVRNSN